MPEYSGKRLFEIFICPHPSKAFGISGAPKSSAPLINTERIKSERGSTMPSFTRRNCLAIVVAPAATAVDIEEPLSVM